MNYGKRTDKPKFSDEMATGRHCSFLEGATLVVMPFRTILSPKFVVQRKKINSMQQLTRDCFFTST